MNLGFDYPWALLLSLLAIIPMLHSGQQSLAYSSLALLPEDALSNWLDRGLRVLAGFAMLLIGVILIVGALTFFPALSLGPILEHLQLQAGQLF